MQFTELVYIAYTEGEIRVIMLRGVFCISTISHAYDSQIILHYVTIIKL